jgi:Fe-S-cluster-containing dehydrogenase component
MGCRACAMSCPYDARYEVTYDDIDAGKEFYGAEELQRQSPSMDKCSFCAHRVDKGMKPACVETCVGSARQFGDLDDPNDPVGQLVASGVAQPLMPHLGTRPNVYYIDDMKRKG